jgi:hypothetical protein
LQHLNWDVRGYFNLADGGIRTYLHTNVTAEQKNAPAGWMGARAKDGDTAFLKQATDLNAFWSRFLVPRLAPSIPEWVAGTCCAQVTFLDTMPLRNH